jgi:hypothetical protein
MVALFVFAALVLLEQVEVHRAGVTRSCGSGWDVVAGRAGWQDWWAEDLSDPAVPATAGRGLVRTAACPGALNRRTALAGTLASAGVVALLAGEILGRRRGERPPGPMASRRALHRAGTALTAGGAVAGIAGAAALALLLADPHAPLFLYVDRTVVALAGILVLQPAIVAVALGRAAIVAARSEAGDAQG